MTAAVCSSPSGFRLLALEDGLARCDEGATRDNARLAGAVRGFGVPASARVGFGAQPRPKEAEATQSSRAPRQET